jgi:hypothetical protein
MTQIETESDADTAETLLDSYSSPVDNISCDATQTLPSRDLSVLSPYMHWTRMREAMLNAVEVPSIMWMLPLRCLDDADAQRHIDLVLGFAREPPRHHFKIGITAYPAVRKSTYREYCGADRLMILTLVSESSDFIRRQEATALSRYRRYNAQGGLVDPHGHVHCENRNPGGEYTSTSSTSPFFLYIISGNHTKWRDKRRAPVQAASSLVHVRSSSSRSRSQSPMRANGSRREVTSRSR